MYTWASTLRKELPGSASFDDVFLLAQQLPTDVGAAAFLFAGAGFGAVLTLLGLFAPLTVVVAPHQPEGLHLGLVLPHTKITLRFRTTFLHYC